MRNAKPFSFFFSEWGTKKWAELDDSAKHLLDNDFGQCCYRGGGGGRGFASQKEEEEEEGSGEHGLSGGELFLQKKKKQKRTRRTRYDLQFWSNNKAKDI